MNLDSKFAGLGLNDTNHSNLNNVSNNNSSSNDGLFQVMKAVEAAEATIKQQVEENIRLRGELQKKIQELERYKSGDVKVQTRDQMDYDSTHGSNRDDELVSDFGNHANENTGSNHSSGRSLSDRIVLHKDLNRNYEDVVAQNHFQINSEGGKVNSMHNALFGAGAAADNPGLSQLSAAAMPSFSPTRLMSLNNIDSLNQDLALKIRDHEEEIFRLQKHIAEYSVKEAQIQNEKYVLEKRIAYMRMAFDQQQQDLVDAASKAISYRQDIMEENIRLTYALQAAHQERSNLVSSLMPLLAEYSFEPAVSDAQSIASNVKVLFRHMQEKLLVTEAKLKESQYQLAPMLSDVYPSNISSPPSHSSAMKNGLELVAQPTYSNTKNPSSSDPQAAVYWDLSGDHQNDMVRSLRNAESDDSGRYSPVAKRGSAMQDVPMGVLNPAELHTRSTEESFSKHVKFKDLVSSEMDEFDNSGGQRDREPLVNRTSKSQVYTSAIEEPSTLYSPYLPPVLEEPSSSFSEAADEDPLPAIEGLQISGEAFPGRILQASGYSINGTTSCNFEWVRHLEDGSFNYIDGAKQPTYLVTADDVDTYLAIEVQPLDNRKRKGELVKVFANDHRKIGCDPEVQTCIEKSLYAGHASFKVALSAGYLDIWQPAILGIKRVGYSIKCSIPGGLVVSEKFSPSTIVSIRYGSPTEFCIIDSQGNERHLRAENVNDISCARDTIVLTLRIFLVRANEKKKGKKRGLFFHK